MMLQEKGISEMSGFLPFFCGGKFYFEESAWRLGSPQVLFPTFRKREAHQGFFWESGKG